MARTRLISFALAGMLTTVAQLAIATEEEPPTAADEEKSDEDAAVFLTGLDFSYWASEQENTYGPGLSWGLVLAPELLEMQITLGAMIGQTYSASVPPPGKRRYMNRFIDHGASPK